MKSGLDSAFYSDKNVRLWKKRMKLKAEERLPDNSQTVSGDAANCKKYG